MAGLQAARERGRRGGRPALMTEDKVKLARSMYESNDYTVAGIAKILGVSRTTVYAHLQRPSTAEPKMI
jgi:DNA invertase Pin-like site-specific DNA recombinase